MGGVTRVIPAAAELGLPARPSGGARPVMVSPRRSNKPLIRPGRVIGFVLPALRGAARKSAQVLAAAGEYSDIRSLMGAPTCSKSFPQTPGSWLSPRSPLSPWSGSWSESCASASTCAGGKSAWPSLTSNSSARCSSAACPPRISAPSSRPDVRPFPTTTPGPVVIIAVRPRAGHTNDLSRTRALQPTGAAIPAGRGMQVLPAAPAAERGRSALRSRGLEMNTGEERVLSELQSALDALAKASEHLEKASQESTASGVSQKVAGAKGLLQELRQEVSYLMHLTRSED